MVACLVLGFPVAYFLALKVAEPAQPDRALHHRAGPVLDELPHPRDRVDVPADGPRGGAEPGARSSCTSSPSRSPELGFSTLSVRLAMIQLYILFMITPLFFTLAQVDRSALEAARDLGAQLVAGRSGR